MDRIQMMWFGREFTNNELLSLHSFLYHGHIIDLYTYDTIINCPKHDNLHILDGREIVKKPFAYKHGVGTGSYSAFSNIFRYRLLWKKGGYWCDLDMICLRKFDFTNEYVFALEKPNQIASCVIRCPEKSPIMKYCIEQCEQVNSNTIEWGQVGPRLLHNAVFHFSLQHFCQKPLVFCPIQWENIDIILSNKIEFSKDVYGIHLWNEIWRRRNLNKNGKWNGLYHELFKIYNI